LKLITRDTDYAIRALCYMAREKNKLVSVSELVDQTCIPKPFLRKILQILNKKGMLKSYKGIGGGFQLKVIPQEMSLLDLIQIFQGPFQISEHTFKNKICPHTKRCRLKKKIDIIEKSVISELKKITLASLI